MTIKFDMQAWGTETDRSKKKKMTEINQKVLQKVELSRKLAINQIVLERSGSSGVSFASAKVGRAKRQNFAASLLMIIVRDLSCLCFAFFMAFLESTAVELRRAC